MTKEELRSKILELEKAMREEDSKSTTAKLSDGVSWKMLSMTNSKVLQLKQSLKELLINTMQTLIAEYMETQRNHLRQQLRVGRQILQKEY